MDGKNKRALAKRDAIEEARGPDGRRDQVPIHWNWLKRPSDEAVQSRVHAAQKVFGVSAVEKKTAP
jgi:hypothetical protein